MYVPHSDILRGTRDAPLHGSFTLRKSRLIVILDPFAECKRSFLHLLYPATLVLSGHSVVYPTFPVHMDPQRVSAPSKAFGEPLPTAALGF